MISSLVLGLGLVGQIGDRFRDEQVYSQMITSLDQRVFHTKEDLSAALSSKPDGFDALWATLDLNEDGQIDQFELAVWEVEGAKLVGMQLGTSEALALAGGAVLEDGDLSKLAIDHEHFQAWFVDVAWASYLESGDQDGDGQLNDSEWRLIVEASIRFAEWMHQREAGDMPGDEPLEADIPVPLEGSVPETLIQAGYVYNQVLAKNKYDGKGSAGDVRRRLQGPEYSMMNFGRDVPRSTEKPPRKPIDDRPMWYWIPAAPYVYAGEYVRSGHSFWPPFNIKEEDVYGDCDSIHC